MENNQAPQEEAPFADTDVDPEFDTKGEKIKYRPLNMGKVSYGYTREQIRLMVIKDQTTAVLTKTQHFDERLDALNASSNREIQNYVTNNMSTFRDSMRPTKLESARAIVGHMLKCEHVCRQPYYYTKDLKANGMYRKHEPFKLDSNLKVLHSLADNNVYKACPCCGSLLPLEMFRRNYTLKVKMLYLGYAVECVVCAGHEKLVKLSGEPKPARFTIDYKYRGPVKPQAPAPVEQLAVEEPTKPSEPALPEAEKRPAKVYNIPRIALCPHCGCNQFGNAPEKSEAVKLGEPMITKCVDCHRELRIMLPRQLSFHVMLTGDQGRP